MCPRAQHVADVEPWEEVDGTVAGDDAADPVLAKHDDRVHVGQDGGPVTMPIACSVAATSAIVRNSRREPVSGSKPKAA